LEKKTSHASEGTLPTAPFISADPAAATSNATSADPETSMPDGTAASLSFPTILSHYAKNIAMLPGKFLILFYFFPKTIWISILNGI
jgi:hypothetical protein